MDVVGKVLIESEPLLGPDVKKIFKATLSNVYDVSTLRDLKDSIVATLSLKEKLSLLKIEADSLIISYFDNDLSDFAVLDANSWEEFIQQQKKILRLTPHSTGKADTESSKSNTLEVAPPSEHGIPNPKTAMNLEYSNYLPSSQENENPFTVNLIKNDGTDGRSGRVAGIVSSSTRSRKQNSVDNSDFESVIAFLQDHLSLPQSLPLSDKDDTPIVFNENHKVWTVSLNDCLIGCVVTYINGVQLSGLDRKLQLALIKQKSRPLHIEFERLPEDQAQFLTIKKAENLVPNIINSPSDSIGNHMNTNNSTSNSNTITESDLTSSSSIKYPLFFSKYSHSSASKIRKRTDATLKDYVECDWATALKEHTGTPQATIISIYKYIEYEMEKLHLFNNKKPAGVGVPDMDEEKWNSVREHIEYMIFKRISEFTRSLWPLFSARSWNPDNDNEESSKDTLRPAYELSFPDLEEEDFSSDKSIHTKLAFLRFINMENLGLSIGDGAKKGTSIPSNSGTFSDTVKEWIMQQSASQLLAKEEWYLAMKGFCQSMSFDTPGEILRNLVNTCKLISHALNTYILNINKINAPSLASVRLKCQCGQVHLGDSNHCQLDLKSPNELDTISPSSKASLDSLTRYSMLMTTSLDSDPEGSSYQLSADDLMPAITWVLIQANPPNIEYNLWLCSEFRHPTLLRGEEAYYLAQLTSAIEFVRNAKAASFELPLEKYLFFMRRYDSTLKLLIACKEGDLAHAKELVEYHNADVNGLSPDNRDTALTACVRFNRFNILEYLLESPQIVVDSLVNLYSGSNQRSTALIIAVQKGYYNMVVALLRAGANRYHQNDDANSAITIASSKKLTRIEIVLIADPVLIDLISAVNSKNSRYEMFLIMKSCCNKMIYINFVITKGLFTGSFSSMLR